MRYMKPQTVIFGLTLQNIIRQNLKKNGTEGKCIEARELIIALPESFYGVSSRQTVADIYRPFQTDLRNGLYRSPASQ